MKTYLIYDRKTGQVLQTHVQADDAEIEPAAILETARPGAQAEAVDVMLVEQLAPGQAYRVDVKAKKLVPEEAGKAPGAGGASAQSAVGDPHLARTVTFHIEQKR